MLSDLENNVLVGDHPGDDPDGGDDGPAPVAARRGWPCPGSFLAGILVLGLMGLTINIVVLFSLILTSGMVVDGAIIVVEYADRKMAEGMPRLRRLQASPRSAWPSPVIAGTCTTLAAFAPLLFWPGVVGEFMKYLPITVLATLIASIAFALVFVPVIGSFVGRVGETDEASKRQLGIAEHGDLRQLTGFTGPMSGCCGCAPASPAR